MVQIHILQARIALNAGDGNEDRIGEGGRGWEVLGEGWGKDASTIEKLCIVNI